MGSNNLRSSHMIDLEESGGIIHNNSMQKVDMLNHSLSGRADTGTRNPEV